MPEAGRTVDEGDDEDVAELCLTREVEAVDSDLGGETDTSLERIVAAAAFTEEGPDEDDAEDACSTDWAGVDDVSGKTVDCRKEVTKPGTRLRSIAKSSHENHQHQSAVDPIFEARGKSRQISLETATAIMRIRSRYVLDVAELSGHADKSHGSTEQHPLKPFLEHTYQLVPVLQDCRRTREMPMFLSDPNQRCTMAY